MSSDERRTQTQTEDKTSQSLFGLQYGPGITGATGIVIYMYEVEI